MRYPDQTIHSIADLIDKLKANVNGLDCPIWYRGQSDANWPLEPKLMRVALLPSESHLLNKFKQDASFILRQRPVTEFEWLFLMQHYGVGTRLLDWSESPLIALYFALTDPSCADKDAALWVLLPTELNRLSNYKPTFTSEIPYFDDESVLDLYRPSAITSETKSSRWPMAAISVRNSPRIQAQQGVFTISHRENIPIEKVGHDNAPINHVWKYVIPTASKNELLKELKLLSFNRFQLFPELESISKNLE